MNAFYYFGKSRMRDHMEMLFRNLKFVGVVLLGLGFTLNSFSQHLIYNGASYDVSRINTVDQINAFNYSPPFLNPAITNPPPITNGDGYNNALGAWMKYSNDGTKVFVSWEVGTNVTQPNVGQQGEMIFEYSLTTPYDLSTATFNGHFLDISPTNVNAEENSMRGFDFNANGSKLFVMSGETGKMFVFNLTTPYDLSTKVVAATITTIPNTSVTDGQWTKYLVFAGNGTKMYLGGGASAFNRVREYNLSTPYDPSTATLVAAIQINSKAAGDGTSPAASVYNDLTWSEDGSKCFLSNEQTPTIYEFATPVPFSFNSAVYLGNSESKLLSAVPNSTIISGDSHNGEAVLAGDGYAMLWEPGGQCLWVMNSSRGVDSGYPKAYRYCLDTGYPEVVANNGAVINTQPITVDLKGCGTQGFADPDNNNLLDVPGQVILGNVPPGLIPILTISATTNPAISKGRVTLTFSGNSTAHQNADDIHKITFKFLDAAFATCPATTVAYSGATTPYEYNAFFDFRDNPVPDSDGDGILDNVDLDDDNDGILDTVENAQANLDIDGDGIPNSLDLDSDNDGISDLMESGNAAAIAKDTNNDGRISNAESPSGANGIPLAAETTEGGTVPAPKDQDGDGKPDAYDLDSDNDGINDLTESGNGPALTADTNGDGTLSASESPVGTDGIPNGAQTADGGSVPIPVDTDADGVPNFRDLDSDNDGINDITEAGIDPDLDGDGLVLNPLVDADKDGIADSVDANDGVFGDPDLTDIPNAAVKTPNGPIVTGPDPDGDGILGIADALPNAFGDLPDNDGDGIADSVDLDDDNDGILDTVEDAQPSADTDGDGIPNRFDLDSDNDGIPDVIESGNLAAIAADTNKDGKISESESPCGLNGIPLAAETTEGGTVPAPKDQDGDGRPDPYDLDSDNDGINDLTESGNPALSADTNGDGSLSPAESPVGADGIPLAAQGGTEGGTVPKPVDTDTDGVPDFRDLDSDNDGLNDIVEAGIDQDTNQDGIVDNPLADADKDGIADSVDANDGVFGDPDTTDSPNAAVKTPNGPVITGPDPDGDGIVGANDGLPNTYGDAPPDNDKDGVPDNVDLDDDNDGILDTVEAAQPSVDTDGDGIPNAFDLDSDNDGIPDLIESGNLPAIAADTNGDGQISNAESPVGANGVPLAAETNEGGIVPAPKDQDGDGKPDPYDLDSDNDGINDLTENGNPTTLAADTNGDGTLSPGESPVGTDGIPAAAQGNIDGGVVPKPVDTDTDGVPDFRDLDADNDGINDIVEAGIDPDPDGNGLVNNPLVDADKDGIPDSVDANPGVFGDPNTTDSPNPAVKTPNGPIITGPDPDGDGILGTADEIPNTFGDALPDADKDGIPDITDLDDDNDGILDTVEDGQASPDTDGDGIPNRLDLDSDNDGITDLVESGNGPAIAADANNDGTITNAESLSGPNGVPLAAETTEGGIVPAPKDQDGDGKPDPYDLDSDNDGINDLTESGNPATLAADLNGDGTLSPTESPVGTDGIPAIAQGNTDGGTIPKPVDTDGDTIPDFRDLDSDNDGINDITEAGVDPDVNGDGLVTNPLIDTDNDGIPDSVDAQDGTFGDPDLTDTPNPAVKTPNGPIVTGPDPDGDGILGTSDGLPNTFGDSPPDFDKDGIPDATDLDDDNDGIVDTVEAAQASPDTDGDGIPNSLDLDSDNDGIPDLIESGNIAAIAADTNNDGTISSAESAPGLNGIPLAAETSEGGIVPAPKDQDGDGRPDPYDLDSDNDGINDLTESGNPATLSADLNGDGTLSPAESPVGTDGIPAIAQGNADGGTIPKPVDTDGDLVPDFRDLDSDNDGINDIIEAGIDPDPDGNGLVNNPLVDADKDGIPDSVDANPGVFGDPDTSDSPNPAVKTPNGPIITGTDPDGDGIVGLADALPNTYGDGPLDTDKDGIPDTTDLDDDNDGILDTVEDAQASLDTDGDGIPNRLDLDSDNDGIPDLIESGNAAAIAADTNHDGSISNAESPAGNNGIPLAAETTEGGTVPAPKDQDGDGKPDPYDLDSDNDGINDLTESGNPTTLSADTNGDGTLSPTESPVGLDGIPAAAQGNADGGTIPSPIDTDGDLIPDFRDLDSDNDGKNDIVEAGIDPDTDGDGQVPSPLVDADKDGIPDSVDANDGVFGDPDTTDTPNPAVKTPNGPIITGPDPDGDGIVGTADALPNAFGDAPDNDNDGIPDTVDLDDDNDGILDTVEAAQPSADTDGDSIPNAFDLDSDNDGISDLIESANAAAIAADTNNDGKISESESPSGLNGVPLAAETTEGGAVPAPKDQDGDGKPDAYDLDSDNDGINDLTESGNPAALTADTNSDGTLSPSESPVGADGIPAAVQAGGVDGGTIPKPVDTDTDGVADFRDLDSDNDGIDDITEAGIDPDVDGNGLVDGTTDADKDGIIDSVDANPAVFGDPNASDGPASEVTSPNGPLVTGADPDGDGILGTADELPNAFGDNNCVSIEIGGFVYKDTDGATTVNGTPVNGVALGLHVTLLQGSSVIEATPVGADGSYKFTNQQSGTYRLLLTTNAAGATSVTLPTGYVTVSEGGAVIAGVSQSDAIKNSETTVTVSCTAIAYDGSRVAATASYLDIDFGINNTAALPIDLVSFNGRQVKEAINLTWNTANAKGFSHFEVLKSLNTNEFGSIGTVESNKINSYNFTDNQPNEGTNYYRLKMYDADGTSKLSNTLAIKFEKNSDFVIVENPAKNGEFKLETNMANPQFNLLNSIGATVPFEIVKLDGSNYVVKIKNQVSGLFYLNLSSEKSMVTKKIINP